MKIRAHALSRLVAGALATLVTAAPLFSLPLPEGKDGNFRTRPPSTLPQKWSASTAPGSRSFSNVDPSGSEPSDGSGVGYLYTSYSPSAAEVPVPGAGRSTADAFYLPGGALPPRQTHAGPEVFSVDVHLNGLLRYYLDYYSSPDGVQWLTTVLERARPFLDFIAKRIQYYHLPPELEFLPIVESTYNPWAVSYTGAAGLWQLMANSINPSTMQINEWQDDRFNFWKATDNALEILKYDHEVLGNWLLALAAYNSGLGTMIYLTQKTGIHDFWTLAERGYLPYETKQYVPKFLAIAAVASYAGRNGIPLNWKPPVTWDRIKLDQAVDLRILARDSGVSLYPLLEGNAELRYAITPPPGWYPYYLKVPASDLSSIEATLKDQRLKLMRFYIYTVGSGDTLYGLARYYGVPVSMILQYNPGVQPRFLQIGTRLVIPGVRDVPPYHPPVASAASSAPVGPFTGSYQVQAGDSLWSIAQRYSTTPEALARANGISLNSILAINSMIRVPQTSQLLEASAP